MEVWRATSKCARFGRKLKTPTEARALRPHTTPHVFLLHGGTLRTDDPPHVLTSHISSVPHMVHTAFSLLSLSPHPKVFNFYARDEGELQGNPLETALRSCGVNPTLSEIASVTEGAAVDFPKFLEVVGA